MRKLALLLVLLVAGVIALVWAAARFDLLSFGRREPAAEPAIPVAPEEARRQLTERLRRQGGGADSEVLLTEGDLHRLLVVKLSEHEDGRRLLAVAREVEAEIEEGRVGLGVWIDLDALEAADLDAEERRIAATVNGVLRLFGQGEVYLGVSGVPTARDGRIALGRDAEVSLGSFSFSLAEFADRFGFAAAEVERGIDFELPYFRVTAVEVLEDAIRLRVSGG